MTNQQKIQENKFPQYPLSSEEIRLLSEVGFMSASLGLAQPATRIFEGLKILRPDQPFIFIGLALAHMLVGSWPEAIYILRDEGLRIVPDSHELQLYLSLVLFASQQPSQGERILLALLENGVLDNAELDLAVGIKNKIDGNIDKSNSPKPAPVIELLTTDVVTSS
jgi:hypothetical protein